MRRYLRLPLSKTEINAINDAVSQLIVESTIPFKWTSSPAFFKFMHALRPDLFNDTEKARIKNGAGLVSQPKNVRGRQWHSTRGLERLHEKCMQAALKEQAQRALRPSVMWKAWNISSIANYVSAGPLWNWFVSVYFPHT